MLRFYEPLYSVVQFEHTPFLRAGVRESLPELSHYGKHFLTQSCTSALEAIALYIGIRPGDEIILPSYTYVSTATAFSNLGASLFFVDVDDSMNLKVAAVQKAITRKTKAIVAVNYGGQSPDLDALSALGPLLIEDTAQGLYATYKGRLLGTIGEFGAISFHETKILHAGGEGGMLCGRFDEKNMLTILQNGTNYQDFIDGKIPGYEWISPGSTFLMDGMHYAYLKAQLRQRQEVLSHLQMLLKYYEQILSTNDRLERMPLLPDNVSNGHLYYLFARDALDRERLIRFLWEHQIEARSHFVPLHRTPYGRRVGRMIGEDIGTMKADRLLRLPLGMHVQKQDIERIAELLDQYYKS